MHPRGWALVDADGFWSSISWPCDAVKVLAAAFSPGHGPARVDGVPLGLGEEGNHLSKGESSSCKEKGNKIKVVGPGAETFP